MAEDQRNSRMDFVDALTNGMLRERNNIFYLSHVEQVDRATPLAGEFMQHFVHKILHCNTLPETNDTYRNLELADPEALQLLTTLNGLFANPLLNGFQFDGGLRIGEAEAGEFPANIAFFKVSVDDNGDIGSISDNSIDFVTDFYSDTDILPNTIITHSGEIKHVTTSTDVPTEGMVDSNWGHVIAVQLSWDIDNQVPIAIDIEAYDINTQYSFNVVFAFQSERSATPFYSTLSDIEPDTHWDYDAKVMYSTFKKEDKYGNPYYQVTMHKPLGETHSNGQNIQVWGSNKEWDQFFRSL